MQDDQNPQLPKRQILLPLLLSAATALGMFIGNQLADGNSLVSVSSGHDSSEFTGAAGSIEEIIGFIESRYVDKVGEKELTEKAINALLNELDPHSVYIPAEELADVNEEMEGEFEGVGMEFMIFNDTITVITPLPGGPAQTAGIIAGDKIVEIGDSTVAGIKIKESKVKKKLRGETGSKVTIGVRRAQEKKLRKFTLTRDRIPIHSVDVAYLLDAHTGYVKINRFADKTHKEFLDAIEPLSSKGMTDLVIDLRQNPGGYLQTAVDILSELFGEKGKLLVYTKGRNVQKLDYKTSGHSLFNIQKVAILIDEGSASASEILAGAIQDWDRGVIVGRRSFGKGLVQEQYSLSDGSALRLTVAQYYTPSGRCIQKPYKNNGHYDEDLEERLASGELIGQDTADLPDSMHYETAGGRIVHGGGGISPDVFVPLDTVFLNEYLGELRQHIPQFAFKFFGEKKAELQNGGLSAFSKNFKADEGLLDAFFQFAQMQGMELNLLENARLSPSLRLLLKAHIARNGFSDEGFFSVMNEADPMVRKAIQQLKQKNPVVKL